MGQQGVFAANSPGSWLKRYRWVLMVYLLLPMHALASEAALRVAFVYNFLKFIEWPYTSTEPLQLCALGAPDDMRKALDQLASRNINKRPIQLTYIDTNDGLAKRLSACHLVYWPDSSRRFLLPDPLLSGMVLVADEGHASARGVSIGLHRNPDGRIEFVVNEAAVEHAGVRISSQLLKLAKNYRDDAPAIEDVSNGGGVDD